MEANECQCMPNTELHNYFYPSKYGQAIARRLSTECPFVECLKSLRECREMVAYTQPSLGQTSHSVCRCCLHSACIRQIQADILFQVEVTQLRASTVKKKPNQENINYLARMSMCVAMVSSRRVEHGKSDISGSLRYTAQLYSDHEFMIETRGESTSQTGGNKQGTSVTLVDVEASALLTAALRSDGLDRLVPVRGVGSCSWTYLTDMAIHPSSKNESH